MQTHQQHEASQAQFAANEAAERARLIKLCNVARADRGWTDDDWAAIKRQHGGADSLKDMDLTDLEAILSHAKACGFRVRHKTQTGSKSRPIDRTDPAQKLRKLWLRGHALGIIKSADESALCSWASNSRATNVTALLESFGPAEFEASIERLKKWLYRELQQGRISCGEHTGILPREAATALIWERPVACAKCGKPMTWTPGVKPKTRTYGERRGR